MDTLVEALQIMQKTTQLEAAMRAPGGIRITEERQLHAIRRWLQR